MDMSEKGRDAGVARAKCPACGRAMRKLQAKSRPPAKLKRPAAKKDTVADWMRPQQPSEELGAIVGHKPLPRIEVTKKLWQYIKRHGLQDLRERRMVNTDDKLRLVFRKRQVSMFEMTKLINRHLTVASKRRPASRSSETDLVAGSSPRENGVT